MTPKFQHDCTACAFLGHYHDHDVYLHGWPLHQSVIARFGDDGPDYASAPLSVVESWLEPDTKIGLLNGPSMLFQDYLFSEHVTKYHKAMLIALARRAVIRAQTE